MSNSILQPGSSNPESEGPSRHNHALLEDYREPPDRITEENAFEEVDDSGNGFCEMIIIFCSILLCIPFFFIAIPMSIKTIKEYERGVILRLGKVKRRNGKPCLLGAGLRMVLPCTDDLMIADLRLQSFNIPPQDVLTRDAVTVKVDAVVYMKIFDPPSALLRVENVYTTAKMTAVSVLRNVIGRFDLTNLLQDRDSADLTLRKELDEATDAWGVKIERVDIKDVSLPMDMQRAMAAEAEATRFAKAKVIAAEGEKQASESLQMAAQSLDKSPSALHLRFLQTLTTIATEQNSTILFPLPMELLRFFDQKKHS